MAVAWESEHAGTTGGVCGSGVCGSGWVLTPGLQEGCASPVGVYTGTAGGMCGSGGCLDRDCRRDVRVRWVFTPGLQEGCAGPSGCLHRGAAQLFTHKVQHPQIPIENLWSDEEQPRCNVFTCNPYDVCFSYKTVGYDSAAELIWAESSRCFSFCTDLSWIMQPICRNYNGVLPEIS